MSYEYKWTYVLYSFDKPQSVMWLDLNLGKGETEIDAFLILPIRNDWRLNDVQTA